MNEFHEFFLVFSGFNFFSFGLGMVFFRLEVWLFVKIWGWDDGAFLLLGMDWDMGIGIGNGLGLEYLMKVFLWAMGFWGGLVCLSVFFNYLFSFCRLIPDVRLIIWSLCWGMGSKRGAIYGRYWGNSSIFGRLLLSRISQILTEWISTVCLTCFFIHLIASSPQVIEINDRLVWALWRVRAHAPSIFGFRICYCLRNHRAAVPSPSQACHTFVTEIGRYPSCYGPEAVWYNVSHALLCFSVCLGGKWAEFWACFCFCLGACAFGSNHFTVRLSCLGWRYSIWDGSLKGKLERGFFNRRTWGDPCYFKCSWIYHTDHFFLGLWDSWL